MSQGQSCLQKGLHGVSMGSLKGLPVGLISIGVLETLMTSSILSILSWDMIDHNQ